MRVDPDRVKWIALAILEGEIVAAEARPATARLSVRLALAWLIEHGGDAECAMAFWRTMLDPMTLNWSDDQRGYLRRTHLRAAFSGLARSMGVRPDMQSAKRLRALWQPKRDAPDLLIP